MCGTVLEITMSVPSHLTINANTMAAMPSVRQVIQSPPVTLIACPVM
jgi:hypothetical protein